jgi:catechol 2,3-dioxygenase-like lactoylglutathione lyase family enzyme
MIKLRRIGHATFETPDLDKQIEHFTQVTGLVVAAREKDRALLATKLGQLVVQLRKGDEPRCAKLAFQVAPESDFKELARALSDDGIKSELRSDDLPGTSKLLAFEDNKGTAIEVFTEWDYLTPNQQVVGIGPIKLGHCAFVVPDVQQTCDFYERVLGFKVSDWNGDFFVFMRCNPDHHTVNFIRGKRAKMHHIAFEVRDFSAVEQGCDVLSHHRIPIIWGPLRHGPGHNVSIRCWTRSSAFSIRAPGMRTVRSDQRCGAGKTARSPAGARRPRRTIISIGMSRPARARQRAS